MSDAAMADFENLRGKKVLLADDLDACRVIGTMFLKILGAEVDIVTNGSEAFKKAIKENYDAILLDIHMPFLDGLSVTQQLREMGIKSPIIVVSSDSRLGMRERAFEHGANSFISKPINIKSLTQTLSRLLSNINLDS